MILIFYVGSYGGSFVAKLNWKKNFFFFEKIFVFFPKYTLFAEKNVFTCKKTFYREKYKWKCKKYISHFRNILLHRKCLFYK